MTKEIIITQEKLNKFDGVIEWAVTDEMLNHMNEEVLQEYESAKIVNDEVIVFDSNDKIITVFKFKIKEKVKMTKKNMMRYAHQLAKKLVKVTENYQIALSYALKEIWRQVKLYNKKRFTQYSIATAYDRIGNPNYRNMLESNANDDVYGVSAWIIRKNLSSDESYAVLNECDSMSVVRETEKAQLVEFVTNHGEITMWTPKSVLVA